MSSATSMHRIVELKDGREAIIRPVRQDDAKGVWETNRAVHEAGEGVVRSVRELPSTVEHQRTELELWISGPRSGSRGCMIVAEVGGVVVGAGHARRYKPAGLRHGAHIGLEVHPDCQGLGIGRALMDAILDWPSTPDGKGVIRLDLSVFAGNERAIKLYESLEFVREGVRKRFVRKPDGREVDDILMALLLDD